MGQSHARAGLLKLGTRRVPLGSDRRRSSRGVQDRIAVLRASVRVGRERSASSRGGRAVRLRRPGA